MKTIRRSQKAVRTTAMLLAFLGSITTTAVVFAQAQLVKDLNTTEYRYFNEYSQLTHAGDVFYFVSNGKELWKSDGTTAGTKRVKAVQGIQNLTLVGNVLYFGSTDDSASELWKSDGTYAGTVRVKRIHEGINSRTPKSFTSANGTVFFVADNGTGYELWKTNGSLSGTVLVKDIWKGPEGSEPSYLTVMNDMLYFSAIDGVHGRELWKSNGTASGTVMVKDIQTPEGESSSPMELVTMNSFLFFSARNSLSGRELWRSDGTANNTIRLKDIFPGPDSSRINSIQLMGNAIYFIANQGTGGTALWRSSGTTAGTVLLKDLAIDDSEYDAFDMTVLNNRIYWVLNTYSGHQVWISNGTVAGTKLATTFENRDTPARFTLMNNKVFFFSAYWSQDPYAPFQQLCSINPDGTEWREIFNMERPADIGGGQDELHYEYLLEMIVFNNALFFPGIRNESEGYKLLKTNGTVTPPPALLVDTYRPTQSSAPWSMVKNNSGIYFQTQGTSGNYEHVWRTDGTRNGTILLKSGAGTGSVVTVNSNTAYFAAWTDWPDKQVFQIWKTDGSLPGTTLLKSLDHYPELLNVGGTLFFHSNQTGELWSSDGTPAGTIVLKKFHSIEHVASSGRTAYILVRTASGGQELWKSNGLPAGTVKVRTIRWVDGPSTSNYRTTATVGNLFYFVGDNGTHGQELWRTDGTATGTYMVKDIRARDNEESITYILHLTAFKNAIYINAQNASGEFFLYKSDGTSSGTHKIYDSQQIAEFMPFGEQLLFIAGEDYTYSLFSTDGTSAGTTPLHQLPYNEGWWVSQTEANGILYFSYLGSDVLWRTDGTKCGTVGLSLGMRRVDNPMFASSGMLLFSAHDNFYGEELFSINVNDLFVPSCPEAFAAALETSKEDAIKHVTYSPNPFDRDFTFVVNSNLQSTAEVAVYDMAGHPLMLGILKTNAPYQLGNNWKEGLYIMRITVNGKVTYERIVKGRR